ncbi:hypothetical protein Cva_01714 [Caedimonas varicaedens]|uniref:Uncharacterized protein n=1 Tax=Caedimonas varicaedens TaxID=1629334 RepID=A0A0K8MET7_9PROT|nr:hypothetical protein Cva_01714 [Caedimonas varicaedens]
MAELLFNVRIAEAVIVGDVPDGGLVSLPLPVMLLAFFMGVPQRFVGRGVVGFTAEDSVIRIVGFLLFLFVFRTGGIPQKFMLVVVIASTQDKMLFCPDDEGDQRKSAGFKILGKQMGGGGRMPDVSHIAGEEFISVRPVGSVIVQDFACAADIDPFVGSFSPFGIVINAVGRIGHHQDRDVVVQKFGNVFWVRAVSAHQAMGAQGINIAQFGFGFERDGGQGLLLDHV